MLRRLTIRPTCRPGDLQAGSLGIRAPEASGWKASHQAAHPHRRIGNKPLDHLGVQQVLLSRIAKRLNPATLPILRPDRPCLQPTDKIGRCLRFQHENAVRNAHEQIDLHRVRAIRQNDVAQHRPSERAHLARDQCPSTRTDRSSKVRLLSEDARRSSPTSSFLRAKLFCINGLVLLLVTICGLHPCISG